MSSSNATGTICPEFFQNGICANERAGNCNYEHAAPICMECKQKFATVNAYTQHVLTPDHIARVNGAERQYRCGLCKRTMAGHDWDSHRAGQQHISKARTENTSPEIEPEEVLVVPNYRHCVSCDAQIHVNKWAQHSLTPRHLRSAQFAKFLAAIEAGSRDRNGVAVSKEGDFGVVEVAVASAGVVRKLQVRGETKESTIKLVGKALTSETSIFSIIVPASSTVVGKAAITISITAKTTHSGRFTDRLELLFEDTVTREKFLIIRLLSIVVGSSVDRDSIRPAAPYQPKQKRIRREEREIVDGIPLPPLSEIEYVKPLPKAPIPGYLAQILSNDRLQPAAKIAQIRNGHLPPQLALASYSNYFRALIWTEEHQTEKNLERYDMSSVSLRREGRRNFLAVAGLAEKRPSVLLGDILLAHPVGGKEGKWYAGHVHEVRQTEVALGFHASFDTAGNKFDIRFKLNRTPMRRQHQALLNAFVQARILFPADVHIPPGTYPQPPDVNLRLYDTKISTNPSQCQAIVSIAERVPGSVPFIVFGPPGTGKTVTVVEAIRQTLKRHPKARILACAPSNAAADVIAERLAPHFLPAELLRTYGPSRSPNQVPSSLQGHICVNAAGVFAVPSKAKLMEYKVLVSTCVSASIFPGIGMPQGHFTHIFIDEAAQATEPEAMISIRLMADKKTNIVLSGDPKQLGPVIQSSIAAEFGLGVSYLERLIARPVYGELEGYGTTVVKLVKSFRSHPAILSFPNERFYNGDLEACADPQVVNAYLGSAHLKNKKFPIVFHSISGTDSREASSPSFFNVDEAILVKEAVIKLLSDRNVRTAAKEIGVIAPYHAQCQKIRKLLKTVENGSDVTVGSVEQFQGQERRVIIISTVRSNQELIEFDLRHTLGFVANPRRFNVAVTRAKALLLIIGDPTVLSLDPLWRRFLNYIHTNKGWKGPAPTWDTQAVVNDAGGYDAEIRTQAEQDMQDLTRRIEMLSMTSA